MLASAAADHRCGVTGHVIDLTMTAAGGLASDLDQFRFEKAPVHGKRNGLVRNRSSRTSNDYFRFPAERVTT